MPVEKIIIGRNREDMKSYGSRGAVYIGKHIVGEGEEAHLTNPVYMDVVRPHITLISGKRGSGKCIEENTLVTLADGRVLPVKDLENDIRSVHGLDNKLKITPLQTTSFFKRKVSKLIKIRTRSGREIRLTPEHPLLTVNGWEDARNLSIGSRIATPRIINTFGKGHMEEHKIKLLAYLIAEGHLANSFVLFSNMDKEIVNDFYHCIEDFNPELKISIHSKPGCFRVTKRNRKAIIKKIMFKKNGDFAKRISIPQDMSSIRKWLNNIGIYGLLSKDKKIPNEVFILPKRKIALFLNRLFSCDGSLYKHKTQHGRVWEISYSSSSETLIRQVQHLLLRFGILSRLRFKKVYCNKKLFNVFELVVGTNNIEKFINEIGFFGRKSTIESSCLEEMSKIKRNPNVDTIPKEVWDIYRPKNWAKIGRLVGYSSGKSLRTSINYGPSRQKLLQIAQFDENEMMKMLAESDIFWDEVVSIEEMVGEFNVCDISVPETHNFCANDIVVHNSYTGAVIAEEITLLPKDIRNNLSVLMIDTMGIYWSMKKPNTADAKIIKEWGLEPKGMNVKLFVPSGLQKEYEDAGVSVDGFITLASSELTDQDWITTFGFNALDDYSILIENTIRKLKKRNISYSIDDIISEIELSDKADNKTKMAVISRFEAAKNWGIFEKTGTKIKDIFKKGVVSVIDVSHYARTSSGWSVRGLLVGILSRKIFQERVSARKTEEFEIMGGESKDTIPMVWIVIDEAHQFIPSEGTTPALGPMLTLIKEGRQPGISLLLITQRPNKLHGDALAQSDLVISHRLTAQADIEALRSVMQTYMLKDIEGYINTLPRKPGSAIVLDDNQERIFPIQIKPRLSWHAGGSPAAIKKKGIFDD